LKKIVFFIMILLVNFLPEKSQGYIEIVGTCPIPDEGWGLEVVGDYAYIACDLSGLQIAEITDPENPGIAASYSTPDRALDLCLVGDHAYIADHSSLQILDISDPISPAFLGSYQSDNVISVHVSGDFAYIGRGYHFPVFEIIDISDPSDPEFVSGLTFMGGADELYYSDGYLYVLSNVTEPYSNYLRAIDVSDPLNPFMAGSIMIPGDTEIPGDIMVVGDYAYIADRSSGLQIVDITDPDNLEIIGFYDTPGDATGIFVYDHYAIIADYYSGIQIIGIVNPTDPFLGDEGLTGSPAIGVFGWVWDLIYVTTTDSLVIFRHPGDNIEADFINPHEFFISQNYPNPFNATTVIHYSLPDPSNVAIEIYDLLGRRVETLMQGEQPAGYHQIIWDAGDKSSGMYFYRIQAGEYTEMKKMVLLK
jgi:hypothetical protein